MKFSIETISISVWQCFEYTAVALKCLRTQKKTALGLNTSQTKPDANDHGHTCVHVCERKARIVCGEHFISLNRLMNFVVKVLWICGTRFSTSFLVNLRAAYASPQKLLCEQSLLPPSLQGEETQGYSKASATADTLMLGPVLKRV